MVQGKWNGIYVYEHTLAYSKCIASFIVFSRVIAIFLSRFHVASAIKQGKMNSAALPMIRAMYVGSSVHSCTVCCAVQCVYEIRVAYGGVCTGISPPT